MPVVLQVAGNSILSAPVVVVIPLQNITTPNFGATPLRVNTPSVITPGTWNKVVDSVRTWRFYVDSSSSPYRQSSGVSVNYTPEPDNDPTLLALTGLTSLQGHTIKVDEVPTIAGVVQAASPKSIAYTVQAQLIPLAVTINVPDITFTQNVAITPDVPVVGTGGTTPYSYAISPALPTGLLFNTGTGTRSGTPTALESNVSHTVTVTDALSATAQGVITETVAAPSSHLWAEMTPSKWTEVETECTALGITNGAGWRNRIGNIPTTGGVTLNPGDNIASAVAANTRVFLNPGNYSTSSRIQMTGGKQLICKGEVNLNALNIDIAFVVSGTNNIISGGVSSSLNIDAADLGIDCFDLGSGCSANTFFHISGIAGLNTGLAHPNANALQVYGDSDNNIFVSCEAKWCVNDTSAGRPAGGDSDGIHSTYNTTGSNCFIDCVAFQNSDDGFDVWSSTVAQLFFFCQSTQNGKNPGQAVGDGNGFKLGTGLSSGVVHKLYKCNTTDNFDFGYNYNDASSPPSKPRLHTCTGSGDDQGLLAGGASFYTIVP